MKTSLRLSALRSIKKQHILFIGLFAVFGVILIVATKASAPTAYFETENATLANGATQGINATASSGKFVQFNAAPIPTPPPPPGTSQQPTLDNTGPRFAMTDITPAQFFNTKSCNKQRITGTLMFDQAWMKGQTFTLTDCKVMGAIYIYLIGGGVQLALADMPVINMDYSEIDYLAMVNAAKLTMDHSAVLEGSQISLTDNVGNGAVGPAPITINNSYFYRFQGNPANGDHTEALHALNFGTGYRFTNVAFIQQGPRNNTATATINFHGKDSIFDGCWFLWDVDVAAYWTVYIDGPNNIVKNSWFDSGAGYVYPDSNPLATYINNRNVDTGELLSLP